jgi:hypothetical protein
MHRRVMIDGRGGFVGVLRWGLLGWSLFACYARIFASDPKTTGDDPSVNRATSAPLDGVPYCAVGNRASTCLLGANCRVTEEGCQACQCLSVSSP